ncbi:glutathione S-transferase [Nemania sp. FL0916]|nr:glutathione S-transferase [Nemania sp. FL0916]
MAPFGKIYSVLNNPRLSRSLVIADLNGLEIEVPPFTMRESNRTPEFLAKFPYGKIPAFEGADGFCLYESLAIDTYLARSGPKANQLLGKDAKTEALITKWAVFSETELYRNAGLPIGMMVAKYLAPDERQFDESVAALIRALKVMDTELAGGKKYLVGNQLTMADIIASSVLYFGCQYYFDPEMQKEIPNVMTYTKFQIATPEFKKRYGEVKFCDARVKFEAR